MTREFGKPPPLSAYCEKLVDQSRFDKKNTAPPSVAGCLGTLAFQIVGLSHTSRNQKMAKLTKLIESPLKTIRSGQSCSESGGKAKIAVSFPRRGETGSDGWVRIASAEGFRPAA
jgi:hypothetical protein